MGMITPLVGLKVSCRRVFHQTCRRRPSSAAFYHTVPAGDGGPSTPVHPLPSDCACDPEHHIRLIRKAPVASLFRRSPLFSVSYGAEKVRRQVVLASQTPPFDGLPLLPAAADAVSLGNRRVGGRWQPPRHAGPECRHKVRSAATRQAGRQAPNLSLRQVLLHPGKSRRPTIKGEAVPAEGPRPPAHRHLPSARN